MEEVRRALDAVVQIALDEVGPVDMPGIEVDVRGIRLERAFVRMVASEGREDVGAGSGWVVDEAVRVVRHGGLPSDDGCTPTRRPSPLHRVRAADGTRTGAGAVAKPLN